MLELHEFTMTPACAIFLRNEIKTMLASSDIKIALMNLCEALDAADETGICIYSGKPSSRRVLFARAY